MGENMSLDSNEYLCLKPQECCRKQNMGNGSSPPGLQWHFPVFVSFYVKYPQLHEGPWGWMGYYCPDYPLYNYIAIPLLCCTEKVNHHCLEKQRDEKQISFQHISQLENHEEQFISTIWGATKKEWRKGISFAYFSTVCKSYADTLREVSQVCQYLREEVYVYCCFFAT